MLPALVAFIEALFYLMCVPVHLALLLDDRGGLRLGAGVSAFVRHRARRRALRDLAASGRKGNGRTPERAWAVLRRLRLERLELAGRLSLGDAAATCLACGMLTGLACALKSRAGSMRADVRPDFSNDLHIELRGMLTARTGHIIRAIILERTDNHGQASH